MKRNVVLVFIAIMFTFIFNGCGTFMHLTGLTNSLMGTTEVTDDVLKQRAAFTLGASANEIEILNRNTETGKNGDVTIYFDVKIQGMQKPTTCYVTAFSTNVSDAVCSGKSNALLDAAKK